MGLLATSLETGAAKCERQRESKMKQKVWAGLDMYLHTFIGSGSVFQSSPLLLGHHMDKKLV